MEKCIIFPRGAPQLTPGDLGYLITFILIFLGIIFRPFILVCFYRIRAKYALEALGTKIPCRVAQPLPSADFTIDVNDQLSLITPFKTPTKIFWWLWGETKDFRWQARPSIDSKKGVNILEFRLFFRPTKNVEFPSIPDISGDVLADGVMIKVFISRWKKNEEPELSFWKVMTRPLTVKWALEQTQRIINQYFIEIV